MRLKVEGYKEYTIVIVLLTFDTSGAVVAILAFT